MMDVFPPNSQAAEQNYPSLQFAQRRSPRGLAVSLLYTMTIKISHLTWHKGLYYFL